MSRRDKMFEKLQRQIDADSRMLREEREEQQRRADYEETRLDAPLTRRELLDSIETVASGYAAQGDHDGDLICNAFQKLAEALR